VAARTALIALPMNVLNSVAFEPRLSEVKRAVSRERHAGSGLKCYVRVEGDVGNVSVFAPETEAINWAGTYHHAANGSLLIVFGNDPKRLPLDDVAAMQVALRRLLPGVDVERIIGWDWTADPFALGTWCVFRPGQHSRLLPELRRSEGRLFFASGDSAVAWRGFIDGAIESGYRAAREIDRHLNG
jgi:monoamine oxidase